MKSHPGPPPCHLYCQMKLKIRTFFLLSIGLSTFSFVFIGKRISIFINNDAGGASYTSTPESGPPFQPQRRSVALQDEAFSYYLNLSVFMLEFPHLQTYRCSALHTPHLESTHDPQMPLLLLSVKSRPESTGRRRALRETWARERVVEGFRVRPVFLMAQTDNVRGMNIVEKESEAFHDILLWDFMEGHHNLSLKERCFLEWLHFSMPNVHYVFKGDDDEFVNPSALVPFIKDHGTPHTLHGAVQHHAVVLRSTKYQVSRALFPNSKYPLFLSGGGFLFPGSSVPLLYRASQEIPVFPLDDVYLGFLVLAANLSMSDNKHFHVWGLKFDPCAFQRAFVVHRINPDSLLKIWTEVREAKCDPADTIPSNAALKRQT